MLRATRSHPPPEPTILAATPALLGLGLAEAAVFLAEALVGYADDLDARIDRTPWPLGGDATSSDAPTASCRVTGGSSWRQRLLDRLASGGIVDKAAIVRRSRDGQHSFSKEAHPAHRARAIENRQYTSAIKTYFRRLETTMRSGDTATADAEHRELVSTIDKAVKRGAMHKNTGARRKSRAAHLRAGSPS